MIAMRGVESGDGAESGERRAESIEHTESDSESLRLYVYGTWGRWCQFRFFWKFRVLVNTSQINLVLGEIFYLSQVGSLELCPCQVGFLELCPRQVGFLELCPRQVGFLELCPAR